ncbi:MAG: S-layer homology domain-containing protein [Clostridia bacterium]|nr:S-layer homology domain-containing protein [Clostridia bacterium]
MKRKLLITFMLMFSLLLFVPVKSYAVNRIVYRLTRISMYEYNVELRWSDTESGNIQVTKIYKKDDDTVVVSYTPYTAKNVRNVTIDVKELGLKDITKKPNILLVNKDGNFNTLSDISGDIEMQRAILNLYQQGIINGYEDGTFKQNNNISKEEFSSMFFGYMGYTLDTTLKSKFSDVANDRWSKNIIMTLNKEGVITGQDDGSFGWSKNVALGEVSTMIARSRGLAILPVNYKLKHTNNFHWANDYISALVTNGLIKDTDNFYTSNSQNTSLTRGQVALMLNRS